MQIEDRDSNNTETFEAKMIYNLIGISRTISTIKVVHLLIVDVVNHYSCWWD